ncbi:TonB-dependent receptor P3 [Dyadobacter sp. CECT 9275]|uniref:TonB-dependent receptor P3 n=1 Tax=Dyadobacter helix TaxID=2822344 RepID=A0A916ND63_9BACT|nr:TonB-dependent receptor [Dyadobacter sp. CECT 9275]CAG5006221.1 TonB-dependent receptor P3 [Dyadobacter sp. CECT 9275]
MQKFYRVQLFIHLMRLSVTQFLLLICLLGNAYATEGNAQALLSQKVTLHVQNQNVDNVLGQIEQQVKARFVYSARLIRSHRKVTLKVKNEPLNKVLDEILIPLALKYRLSEDLIIISRSERPAADARSEPLPSDKAQDQASENGKPFVDVVVKGRVRDEKGEGLPGVSIVIKGTAKGTTTDAEGKYQISVDGPESVLIFSFVGYKTTEKAVGLFSEINIDLPADQSLLNEVIVVGYGTKKRENVTGAIAQVSGEALVSRPVVKLGQALQGLIPNLNVTNPDGNPNANPTFNIRGTTSLSGGGALILVDGIQMDINLLNPADVESITVLKDAASAAIYGARGAFGVILVTTKKGRKDRKPQISYSGSMQFNKPTYLPDLLSTSEYLESQNVAQKNLNGTQKYADEQIGWVKDYQRDPVNNPSYHMLPNGKIFWNASPNVIKDMVQMWAPGQSHTLNLNGGNDKTSYYVSGGFLNQNGLFKTSTDVFKRYNFTTNVTTDLTEWFKVGAKVNYVNTSYDEPHKYPNKGSDWWEQMTRGEPQVLFPAKTPAGSPVGEGIATESFVNFLESGSRKINKSSTGVYAVNAEAEVIDGLKVSGNFSYTALRQTLKENQVAFPYIRDTWITQISGTSPSFIQRDFNSSDYFAGNLYADYNTVLAGKHSLSALVGYNQEWYNLTGSIVRKQDLVSGGVPVFNLATGTTTTTDVETSWAIRGVFARLNYDYMGKYLVEFNSRYDGTSRFPAGRRFGFFPSVSAGWRISKEKFMKPLSPVLHDLKLRASYGSLGNQLVDGNFPYISLFGITPQVSHILGGTLPLGISAPGLVSPDLTWEKVSTLDFGADANLWGKLNIGFDWYRRTTAGMLVAGGRLPAVLGTAVPQRNAADLQTTGFEFSAKWTDQLPNKLRYDVGVVLSNYQAVITKIDNNPNKLITDNYVGQKIGEIWGFESAGIFTSSGDVTSAANQDQLGNSGKWGAGDVQYRDLNSDRVITRGANTVANPGDQKIIGNLTPKYQYGITANLAWFNFDFSLLIQGVGKRDFVPSGSYFWGAINNPAAVGTREVYQDSWSAANPGGYYPIYKAGSTFNILPQTRYLQSAAYMRLKNISLGYTVPLKAIKKIRLSNARLYVTGQNLWEYTKLKGNFDPEVTGSGDVGVFYPLQRVLSFGVQLSL